MSPPSPSNASRPVPRLGRWWWAILAFCVLLGFVTANQIYLSMLDHHHSWWRIFLWQAGSSLAWAPLVPVVFALARLAPFDFRWRTLVHVPAALAIAFVHLVPVALLAMALDPYTPVETSASFAQEYGLMMRRWLGQDLVVYAALLALLVIIDQRQSREERQRREALLQAELARAQLRALRLELQPHFIFNALNAVVGLLRRRDFEREDVAQAEEMLLGLSELLRRTLEGRERQLVPLAEELRLAELYLGIQQIRFADRLQVELAAAPGTEQALVPSLLLQPLVENAVHHGVSKRAEPGRIRVLSERRSNGAGESLVLRVTDDGPGPDPDAAWVAEENGRGVGLDNARQRLAAIYGDDWRLDLLPGADGGAEVSIRIPWQVSEPA